MAQNRATVHGLCKFDKRYLVIIQKFHQPTKYSTKKIGFSLLHLQLLEFAHCHLFHCLLKGNEQSRQNVGQLGLVFETTYLLSFSKKCSQQVVSLGITRWTVWSSKILDISLAIFKFVKFWALRCKNDSPLLSPYIRWVRSRGYRYLLFWIQFYY